MIFLCHVITWPVWEAACSQLPHSCPPAQGDGLSGSVTEWGSELSLATQKSLTPSDMPTRTRVGVKLITGCRWVSGLNAPCGLGGPVWGRGQTAWGVLGHTVSSFRVSGCSGPLVHWESAGEREASARSESEVTKTWRHFFQPKATHRVRDTLPRVLALWQWVHPRPQSALLPPEGVSAPGSPLGVLRPAGRMH